MGADVSWLYQRCVQGQQVECEEGLAPSKDLIHLELQSCGRGVSLTIFNLHSVFFFFFPSFENSCLVAPILIPGKECDNQGWDGKVGQRLGLEQDTIRHRVSLFF